MSSFLYTYTVQCHIILFNVFFCLYSDNLGYCIRQQNMLPR
jgi:hypothetical protein